MVEESAIRAIGIYRKAAGNAIRGASVKELISIVEEGLRCNVVFQEVFPQQHSSAGKRADESGLVLAFDMYGRLPNLDAISFVRESEPFSKDEAEIAEFLADLIAVTIADHDRAQAIRWQATKGLVSSLLDGSYSDSISIAEAANTVAFDIGGSYRVMSIEISEQEPSTGGDKLDIDQLTRNVEKIANEHVRRAAEGLALKMGRRIVVLVKDPNENRFEEIARAVAEELLDILNDAYPRTSFTICIGSVCSSPEQYEDAYKLIEQIAELNKSIGTGQNIISLKQFGAKALFYSALRPEALLQFASNRLKPLIEYDREQSGNLVKTLRVYLDCGGNVSQAAQQLFISYGGMRYRLREIERLIRADIKNANVIYELFFALDVLEISGEEAVLSR